MNDNMHLYVWALSGNILKGVTVFTLRTPEGPGPGVGVL